jgi:hypothetical protein
MMKNRLLTISVILLISTPQAWAQETVIDPSAVNMLQRMTDYLSNLSAFTVHTQNTLEHVIETGQRIDEDLSVSMTLNRPDKLHAKRLGGLIKQTFYYDGKSLTIYNQNENVYATSPAPGTIEEMLDYARETLGLILPASDLAYRNMYSILMQDVTSAMVVGKAVINDQTCNHLAFSRPDADFQIWVTAEERPLPCKYVVTDKSDPVLISTTSIFSNWNFKPSITDSSFTHVPSKGVEEVNFLPLDKNSDPAKL